MNIGVIDNVLDNTCVGIWENPKICQMLLQMKDEKDAKLGLVQNST